MTAKRDKKDEQKAAKKPKLKKETVKDLESKNAENVKAGRLSGPNTCYSNVPEYCSL